MGELFRALALKRALEFYLHNVIPSQHLVRPEVMDAFQQSVARNRELLERLATEMAQRVYLTIAEVYQMQHQLIDMFGGLRGLHGVRDTGLVEAAVCRPQTGYYNSIEEEAAALMDSLGNNHGFINGNKRIGFTATDVVLRSNGFYIHVAANKDTHSSSAQ